MKDDSTRNERERDGDEYENARDLDAVERRRVQQARVKRIFALGGATRARS